MKKILIVAPHPDDAELGMGGTIAKMLDSGWDVTIVDLTDGEPTPFGSRQIRHEETNKSNAILGIKNRICLGMPNRYLQANLENRKKLSEIIRLNQPDLLFGPVLPDWHPDHKAAAELVEGARFEAKFHKTDMAGVPHWTPGMYGYYSTHRPGYDNPLFVVDITDYWERKIKAIEAYQSQLQNSVNQVSLLEKAEVVCRYFGQCAGVKYAEPFAGCQLMRVDDLRFMQASL